MICKQKSDFDKFSSLVSSVLSVPRSVMVAREKEYRKQVDDNQNRRGPKRKIKPPASHDLADRPLA
jgi:hypothetical protein